jgi:hypothetical protein
MRTLCLLLTLVGTVVAAPAAQYFEPADSPASIFAGRGFGYTVELSAGSVRIAGRDAKTALRFRLDRATATAAFGGEDRLPSHAHYFIGKDPSKWRAHVPQFAQVRAHEVYPGTDLVYYAGTHGLEFDFVLAPRANVDRIRLRFDRRVSIDRQGALRDAASGEQLLDPPQAYELDAAGGHHRVPSRFRAVAGGVVTFAVKRSDPKHTLVIDPTLVYATFLGGSGVDTVVGAQRGPDGGLYVAGHTTSNDLPQAVSLNSILNRPIYLSATETFVARYTPDGSALVYVVYVGGVGPDTVTSMAVDPQGRATVAGYTYSSNFPTTTGAFQGSIANRGYDGFCFRLSADGSTLEYSTYLAVVSPTFGYLGTNNPPPLLTGVDAQGTAVIAGTDYVFPSTSGPDTAFGVAPTPGAFQQKQGGGIDGFLMRLNNSGTALLYATWLGGSLDEKINALAVDDAGNAFVGGTTQSSDFPLAHAFQSAPPTGTAPPPGFYYSGNTAGFLAKVAPDGRSLVFSSYYGGQRGNTGVSSLALDASGAIYVAGTSAVAAAPGLTEVPGQPPSGVFNMPGFLMKLDPSGQTQQFAWAYSVMGLSNILRVRVDASSRPCLLGSISAQKITPGALFGGTNDGTGITCLEADGETIRYATLPPGSGPNGIRPADFDFDNAGNPVVAAIASPYAIYGIVPPVTANAPQSLPSDGYIFKLIPDNPLPQLYYVSPGLITTPISQGPGFTNFTVSGTSFAPGVQVLWNGQPLTTLLNNGLQSVNATTLGFRVSDSTLMQQPHGDQQLTVSLPAPGGGVSNALTVKYINPSPGNLVIVPSVVPAGSGDLTFTITGSFTADCTVTWDGQPIIAVPRNLAQPGLQISVPASAFARPGDHVVTVTNPPPGGGVATLHVSVTTTGLPQSILAITGPVVVGVAEAGLKQTISASGYASNDVTVVWNGSDRPTSVVNANSLQFVLSLDDVSRMGSAQVQIKSGGVLSSAVTAYIGVRIAGIVTPDPARGRAYVLTTNPAGQTAAVLASVAIPGGSVLQTVDLGVSGRAAALTDDDQFIYVTAMDGSIRRVNLDTFAVDTTMMVPAPMVPYYNYGLNPAAVPVAGSSSTIAAAGIDGIVRIFDNGVPRPNTTANLMPNPGILSPVFATPDVVGEVRLEWLVVHGSPALRCDWLHQL